MSSLSVYIPPFASDYTGVCSALFDYNSLIVVNDAHCCTGTYVHYDEPRWVMRQRPTLCTMLRHMDAILGNDEKVISQVTQAANDLKPEFIAILGSPVPSIIGMDTFGMAMEIESRTCVPVIGFDTTGFSLYDQGVSKALVSLCKKFAEKCNQHDEKKINLLGLTPLDFGIVGNNGAIKDFIVKSGFTTGSDLCMETKLEEIRSVGDAATNLVVSSSGIAVAKYLKKTFDQNYVIGCPIGTEHKQFLAAKLHGSEEAISKKNTSQNLPKALIIGDQVISNSVREAIEIAGAEYSVDVATFFKLEPKIARINDAHIIDEADLAEILEREDYDLVIGDPLICALPQMKGRLFSPIVHHAVSSKLHWKDMPILINLEPLHLIKNAIKI